MPLSPEDIEDIKLGMYEGFEEVYSSQLYFLVYDSNFNLDDLDVYEDVAQKQFLTPLKLVSKVSLEAHDKTWTPKGPYEDFDIEVIVPLKAMEDTKILAFSEDVRLKSRLSYLGIQYRIVSIDPQSIISDYVLKYVIKGKRAYQ